jgi:hypothetical protein
LLCCSYLPFHVVFVFGNMSSWIVMAFAIPMGIWRAKQKRIEDHRRWMILAAAAMFLNPIQRIYWILLGRNGYGAPYNEVQDYIDHASAVAEMGAIATAYVLAAVYLWSPSRGSSAAAVTDAAADKKRA